MLAGVSIKYATVYPGIGSKMRGSPLHVDCSKYNYMGPCSTKRLGIYARMRLALYMVNPSRTTPPTPCFFLECRCALRPSFYLSTSLIYIASIIYNTPTSHHSSASNTGWLYSDMRNKSKIKDCSDAKILELCKENVRFNNLIFNNPR